jgi:hypothetical protein
VPNLLTDRGFGMGGLAAALNVRRSMYQALIWRRGMLRDGARRLRSPLHAEDCKRLADALIDGVRGNGEAGGDFL